MAGPADDRLEEDGVGVGILPSRRVDRRLDIGLPLALGPAIARNGQDSSIGITRVLATGRLDGITPPLVARIAPEFNGRPSRPEKLPFAVVDNGLKGAVGKPLVGLGKADDAGAEVGTAWG